MSDTRVKMDMIARSIELEGSEAFVTRYLEEFKSMLLSPPQPQEDDKQPKRPNAPKAKAAVASTGIEQPKAKSKRTPSSKLVAEKYDIHGGNGKPSLEAFFAQKSPGEGNGDRIAVIGYYITEILGNASFSEGQIEYSLKMLKLDRPAHLRQIMINTKNSKDYYEQVENEPGKWAMTRGGDIFVADKLPPKESE
jgi:hypothetical protein